MPSANDNVDQLYWSLIHCDSDEDREAMIRGVQATSAELAERLRAMLHNRESAERVFGRLDGTNQYLDVTVDPQFDKVTTTGSSGGVAELKSGAIVGSYKLLEPIGEGGMGVVYLAQQSEPVRRKVALKIIKPGMDSRQIIARFEAERQALAMMEHLNIAKVLDAGTTGSGLPFFAMELVRGIPMSDYCDRAKMPTRQRLELFCDACSAIQHAHNKGIIHRDIKPSNVLITEHDGAPVVKVIDFGVAKALTGNLTNKTLYTGMFQMIGTPLYMSPEQASLSNLDVDTRSDVYSLGVMLYELITGTLPIERERAKELSFDELRNQICSTEPPRPSKRISTLKDERETVAVCRAIEPKHLRRMVSGEIDWVVMKAIEKHRSRRYQSARELGEDVRRHLTGEAVQACPPTTLYNLKKFATRHRGLLATLSAIAITMIGAAAVSLNLAFAADQAKRKADLNLAQSNRDFRRAMEAIDLVVDEVSSNEFDRVEGIESVREDISDRAIELYQEISEEHGDDPESLFRSAKANLQLAKLYAIGREPEQQFEHYQNAESILTELSTNNPDDSNLVFELARGIKDHAYAYEFHHEAMGRNQAIKWIRKSIELMESIDARNLNTENQRELPQRLASGYGSLAMFYEREHQLEQAKQAILTSIAYETAPDSARRRILGFIELKSENFDRARNAFERACEIAHQEFETNPESRSARESLFFAEHQFGEFLKKIDRVEEAKEHWRTSRSIILSLAAEFPNSHWYYDWYLWGKSFEPEVVEDLLSWQQTATEAKLLSKMLEQRFENETTQLIYNVLSKVSAEESNVLVAAISKSLDHPNKVTIIHFLNGMNALIQRDLETAQQRLRDALSDEEIRSKVEDRIFELANTILDEESEQAIWLADLLDDHLRRHSRSNWRMPELWFRVCQAERKRGDLEAAMHASQKGIDSKTDHHAGWVSQGAVHHALGDYQSAIADYTTAIELHPSPPQRNSGPWWIVKRRAESHFRNGDFDKALDDIRRSMELNSQDSSALTWIPPELVASCPNPALAEGILHCANKAVEENPEIVDLRVQRGRLLAAMERAELALVDFNEAVERHPENVSYRTHRIQFYLDRERWDDAKADLVEALEAQKNGSFSAYYQLGLLSLRSRNQPDYQHVCRELFEGPYADVKDGDPLTAFFVAWTTALGPNGVEDYETAIRCSQYAVDSDPNNRQYVGGLGAILYRAGDLLYARNRLRRSIALAVSAETSSAYSHYFLAMVEHRLGNPETAEQLQQEANQLADEELSASPSWNRKLTLDLLRTETDNLLKKPFDKEKWETHP